MDNQALIHLQIFYEIAMSIGTSLDLDKMLKSSLTVCLKKLSCNSGMIYQMNRQPDNMWRFTPQCVIPRNAEKKALTINGKKLIPQYILSKNLTPYLKSLPASGITDSGLYYLVMELPDFGIICLFKSDEGIDVRTIQSLFKINDKLAGSATACLQNKKIEKINRQLTREIIDRKQAEKAKSQFLANMNHELMTPLNGIIGLNKLMKEKGLPAGQEELSDILDKSAQSLLGLLKDLLEFSTIDAKTPKLKKAEFSIDRLVNSLLKKTRKQAKDKGLELSSRLSPDLPSNLVGDRHRIHQALIHLVENAIKYTDKGHVILHAEECASDSLTNVGKNEMVISFSIEDSGVGIPDDLKQTLFETFTQADNSDTRQYGGLGLGLAISYRIASILNGKIHVADSMSGGSVFTFMLPVGLCENSDHQVLPAENSDISADIRALIVEDNPVNQMVIKGICKKLNWKTDCAKDGREAVELLEKEEFNLVLMDCQMPVMDGYEATQIIRNPNSKILKHDVPIIAVTANVSDENRLKCLKTGMDDFITKPINLEKIQSVCMKYL